MKYLNWNETTITDFSPAFISEMYENGYVFTRIGKGVMQQTRSVRIDLSKFQLTSENRRILSKVPDISLYLTKVPVTDYSYPIGKLAKDFYDTKFGPSIMSAQKIKEMLTDPAKSNFNCLLKFEADKSAPHGYAICYENGSLLHYSYPFYDLKESSKDMGLGMMTKALEWAKSEGKKYVYLGSLQRPSDTYKLQFEGLEWFDGGPNGSGTWKTGFEEVKKILASAKM
jgi:arginyl-tRNA--protein-N-Asp/Glu arginylyltransferase